jgi:hypothetical protein
MRRAIQLQLEAVEDNPVAGVPRTEAPEVPRVVDEGLTRDLRKANKADADDAMMRAKIAEWADKARPHLPFGTEPSYEDAKAALDRVGATYEAIGQAVRGMGRRWRIKRVRGLLSGALGVPQGQTERRAPQKKEPDAKTELVNAWTAWREAFEASRLREDEQPQKVYADAVRRYSEAREMVPDWEAVISAAAKALATPPSSGSTPPS